MKPETWISLGQKPKNNRGLALILKTQKRSPDLRHPHKFRSFEGVTSRNKKNGYKSIRQANKQTHSTLFLLEHSWNVLIVFLVLMSSLRLFKNIRILDYSSKNLWLESMKTAYHKILINSNQNILSGKDKRESIHSLKEICWAGVLIKPWSEGTQRYKEKINMRHRD